MAATKLLFVCTGNICRSAMAEHLMRHLAARSGAGVEVASCGLAAETWLEVPPAARRLLEQAGVPPFSHRPRLVTRDQLRWADAVLVMTRAHEREIVDRYPEFASKVRLLTERAGLKPADVPDPIGRPDEEFASCLAQIRTALEALLRGPLLERR